MNIIIVIAILIFLYWLFIFKPGRLDFWKIANKYPNEAYDFFVSQECWKVFEESLPDDYSSIVSNDDWTGPFRLRIPKIGNKIIYVFGKHPYFERAQNEFMTKFRKETERNNNE